MRALLIALTLASLAGCPRGGAEEPSKEPQAEPAPVEIDWPDAGAPPPRSP